ERRLALLLIPRQRLTEPGHGPVQVVQLQGLTPGDLVVGPPLVGGPVAARSEEAVQDGEEDRPLDVELEAAAIQQSLDDLPATGLSPEPLEDEGRPDASGGDGGQSPLGMGREQEDRVGQAGARGEQGVELTGLLELVKPAEGGDDPLAGSSALPAVLDDLEVGAGAGGLGAEEHGTLVFETP